MTKGHSMARWLPGPGVGGHCLPIDPMYLAWQARTQLGRRFRFAELADEINNGRPREVVELAGLLLNEDGLPFKNTDVLVLGVAYKPGVGDVRESPALPIIEGLEARGACVTVCDPYVTNWTRTPIIEIGTLYAELPRFPLVIVITHHDDVDYEKIATARRVLDTRNVVPAGPSVVTL
jgi:UDP-N-acetyl-D-glucosamine dehydrogenase